MKELILCTFWLQVDKMREAWAITATIPAKGARLQLYDSTKNFWKPILRRDGNRLREDNAGQVFINGQKKQTYHVKWQ